jgi:hypothetical protein
LVVALGVALGLFFGLNSEPFHPTVEAQAPTHMQVARQAE